MSGMCTVTTKWQTEGGDAAAANRHCVKHQAAIRIQNGLVKCFHCNSYIGFRYLMGSGRSVCVALFRMLGGQRRDEIQNSIDVK